MKALLDTQTLFYAANEPKKLGPRALRCIDNTETVLSNNEGIALLSGPGSLTLSSTKLDDSII